MVERAFIQGASGIKKMDPGSRKSRRAIRFGRGSDPRSCENGYPPRPINLGHTILGLLCCLSLTEPLSLTGNPTEDA